MRRIVIGLVGVIGVVGLAAQQSDRSRRADVSRHLHPEVRVDARAC